MKPPAELASRPMMFITNGTIKLRSDVADCGRIPARAAITSVTALCRLPKRDESIDVPSLTLAIDGDGVAPDEGIRLLKDLRVEAAPVPGRLEMTTVRDRAGSLHEGAAERIADHLIRWVGSERFAQVPRIAS